MSKEEWTLRAWSLLAVERDDDRHSLTEFLQLASGVLFRETTYHNGAMSVALTFAPGLELEDPAAAPGLRLARP